MPKNEVRSTLKITAAGEISFNGSFQYKVLGNTVVAMAGMYSSLLDENPEVLPKDLVVDIIIADDGTVSFEPSLQKEDIPLFIYTMAEVLENYENRKAQD